MKIHNRFAHFLFRLFFIWLIDTFAVIITASLLDGVNITSVGNYSDWVIAIAVAFTLGMMNFLIRPLLLLLTLPLGSLAVFLVGFVINGIVLWLASVVMPGFEVNSFWSAIIGAFTLSVVNTVLMILIDMDDDESFYENLVQRQAARQADLSNESTNRGLVILETDGLSYQRIQDAIAKGYMPTLKAMIEEEGYTISHIDCGVPSTTPSCQAGILHGNNTNIPAFRWLDKKTGRMMVGPVVAGEVEPVLSDGKGLVSGGSSIGNMFSGDAEKSLFTFSKARTGTPEEKKERSRDMFMLMRNPYFFTRTLVLFFGDVLLEIWQGIQQKRHHVQPRLNRLHNGYPVLRAVINVFLRELSTYFTILDILRGTPAIYTLYAGYDEVAHHSGPLSSDVLLTLRQFDRQVARIKSIIEHKAKRSYEIMILSDHGQSWGATFKQRYGISIKDFIQQQLPGEDQVASSGGGDDGTMGVSAMMDEMQNMKEQKTGGAVTTGILNQAHRSLQRNLSEQPGTQDVKPAKVTIAYGGNAAMVYFDLYPRKILLSELNNAYPGMVDSLVKHEAIGFVVALDDNSQPVAFGKKGARNLTTGDVTGEDPLIPYGDVELRAWQLKRICEFTDAGDLLINSTIFPDGSVAAMEELIGNHGGLGGEQTDAYLFHPGDMQVPETRGSFEVKEIIRSRRELPGIKLESERTVAPVDQPWAITPMLKGLLRIREWASYALRVLLFDRSVYVEISTNNFMTGPALLIILLAALVQSMTSSQGFSLLDFFIRFGVWFIGMIFLYISARILRGKTDFPSTLRVVGFALTASVYNLLAYLPVFGTVSRSLAILLVFFNIWLGTATAQGLKGWKAIVLPLIYLVVYFICVVFLLSLYSGVSLALNSFLIELGISPHP